MKNHDYNEQHFFKKNNFILLSDQLLEDMASNIVEKLIKNAKYDGLQVFSEVDRNGLLYSAVGNLSPHCAFVRTWTNYEVTAEDGERFIMGDWTYERDEKGHLQPYYIDCYLK